MVPRRSVLTALAALVLLLAGCGYYNPNLLPADEQGPPILLHVPIWTNQTNEIGLETVIHNALNDWLIQNKRIVLAKTRQEAEYELNGTILSADFPGLSYGATDRATALKAVLRVRYTLVDTRTGKNINQRNYSLEDNFSLGASTSQTDENKRKALESLADDLAENIYIQVYRQMSRHKKRSAAGRPAGAD